MSGEVALSKYELKNKLAVFFEVLKQRCFKDLASYNTNRERLIQMKSLLEENIGWCRGLTAIAPSNNVLGQDPKNLEPTRAEQLTLNMFFYRVNFIVCGGVVVEKGAVDPNEKRRQLLTEKKRLSSTQNVNPDFAILPSMDPAETNKMQLAAIEKDLKSLAVATEAQAPSLEDLKIIYGAAEIIWPRFIDSNDASEVPFLMGQPGIQFAHSRALAMLGMFSSAVRRMEIYLLTKHRHDSPAAQREYDKHFGLMISSLPSSPFWQIDDEKFRTMVVNFLDWLNKGFIDGELSDLQRDSVLSQESSEKSQIGWKKIENMKSDLCQQNAGSGCAYLTYNGKRIEAYDESVQLSLFFNAMLKKADKKHPHSFNRSELIQIWHVVEKYFPGHFKEMSQLAGKMSIAKGY